MFNLRLCNAAIIRYSQLKFRHMHLCGMDYMYFSPHCCKCNSFGCTAAIRCDNACHGPHSDSLYSGSEHCQFNSPRLVKREAGFPNPRRALIGSNQPWRVNDSAYYREFRNWIDPNPATCLHTTPYIPSCYNNEQTTKQTKAINNSYRYISHVNVTQTVPDISPLMPMHQDPLLVFAPALPELLWLPTVWRCPLYRDCFLDLRLFNSPDLRRLGLCYCCQAWTLETVLGGNTALSRWWTARSIDADAKR